MIMEVLERNKQFFLWKFLVYVFIDIFKQTQSPPEQKKRHTKKAPYHYFGLIDVNACDKTSRDSLRRKTS